MFCLQKNAGQHLAFVVTVSIALIIFIIMYVLVYVEYYFWCQLKLFAVVIWISLLAIGYVSIFDNPTPAGWEQVFLSPNYDVILAPKRDCLCTPPPRTPLSVQYNTIWMY